MNVVVRLALAVLAKVLPPGTGSYVVGFAAIAHALAQWAEIISRALDSGVLPQAGELDVVIATSEALLGGALVTMRRALAALSSSSSTPQRELEAVKKAGQDGRVRLELLVAVLALAAGAACAGSLTLYSRTPAGAWQVFALKVNAAETFCLDGVGIPTGATRIGIGPIGWGSMSCTEAEAEPPAPLELDEP